ncbi:ion channel [Bacillus sp. MM09(2025)]|uniref:ion channel n=1 Tax=Bacillus TaxID=1386 RepID=UPI0030D1E2DF
MKYVTTFFIFLIAFLFSHPVSAEENIKITKVIDVSTIEINNQSKIKLYGISDSIYKEYKTFKEKNDMLPFEINYNSVGDLEHYTLEGNTYNEELAIEEIKKLLLNKYIYIKEVQKDKYLIFFSDKDEYSVNQLIISKGFALVDENIDIDYKMKFLLEQKNAEENQVGIWSINFKTVSSGKSELSMSNSIYIIISIIIFINTIILLFAFKKLSSLPNWKGLFYGLFSLMSFPCPSIIISFQHELIAKFYLLLIFSLYIFIFYYLIKYIFKFKENLTIKKLLLLIIGAIIIVIFYFSNVYSVFDKPRSIHTLEQTFAYSHIISDSVILTGDYIYVNNQLDSFNFIDDYLYFSATTFFGGSYGDVIPKGNIRYIVLIEMLISFILQLVFFGIIFNVVYEKFNNNTLKQITRKREKEIENLDFKKYDVIEVPNFEKEEQLPSIPSKKSTNKKTLLLLVPIFILLLLFRKKK